jgi:hypothetical protein
MKRIAAVLALAFAFGASPAHSQYTVRLAWTASADAAANPSLTDNVYRAATCPGRFAKINSAPVTAASYVDTSAGAGVAYCYQGTAVLSGAESAPSNQAVAAVPPPSDRQAAYAHHGPIIGWIRCVGSRPKKNGPAIPATRTQTRFGGQCLLQTQMESAANWACLKRLSVEISVEKGPQPSARMRAQGFPVSSSVSRHVSVSRSKHAGYLWLVPSASAKGLSGGLPRSISEFAQVCSN